MAVPWACWPPGMMPSSPPQPPSQPNANHPTMMPMMHPMMHPMMMGGYPGSIGFGIPSIPPSSNPLIVDPAGAVRDFTEHATNADRQSLCDVWDLQCLIDWGKDEAHRKTIMEVIKSRLDLPWPHNYKALDVLAVMPLSEAVALHDKLKALSETPASTEGAAELKKIVKPILEKVEAEKRKAEEEDFKKKQEAISAMWGGLWANDQAAKAPGGLAAAGWYGWQYPYQVVPGVPAQAQVGWNSKAPEGWRPASITPTPQIYPFSRTGYYSLLPAESAPKTAEKLATYTVSVSATPTSTGGKGTSACVHPFPFDIPLFCFIIYITLAPFSALFTFM